MSEKSCQQHKEAKRCWARSIAVNDGQAESDVTNLRSGMNQSPETPSTDL